jgi:hypothetical protein
MKIEIEIPTEMIVWQSPDKAKAACPSTGRLPVLMALGHSVQAGVLVDFHDEFWFGEETDCKKLKPEEIDWWAKLPVPPGQSEAIPGF